MAELVERIITSQTVSKSLVIVATRSIEGSHLKNSLSAALEKHLPKDPVARAAAEREVTAFKTLFPKGMVTKGHGLVFNVLGRRISVEYDGARIGEIEAAFVAESFVRLYLGHPPATQDAKENILRGMERGFHSVLQH